MVGLTGALRRVDVVERFEVDVFGCAVIVAGGDDVGVWEVEVEGEDEGVGFEERFL
jgi:hypothetical protein